jgi:hypothetical protein
LGLAAIIALTRSLRIRNGDSYNRALVIFEGVTWFVVALNTRVVDALNACGAEPSTGVGPNATYIIELIVPSLSSQTRNIVRAAEYYFDDPAP